MSVCKVFAKMATIIPLPVCMLLCSSLHYKMESISFPLGSDPGYDLLWPTECGRSKAETIWPRPPRDFEVFSLLHGPCCCHVNKPSGPLENETHHQALLHPSLQLANCWTYEGGLPIDTPVTADT